MKTLSRSQIRGALLTLLLTATAAVAPTSAQTPTPSPNGKIAFVTNRDGNYEIYVMEANGSNPTRLTNNAAEEFGPAWSPDGTKIAFQTFRDGNYEIYVMDANGSNPANLTNHPDSDFTPAWSPDGAKIAFVSLRGVSFQIWVMNANGSNQTALTVDSKTRNSAPSWSSDGNKIAYQSQSTFDNDDEVWVMNANGSNKVNLTNNPGFDGVPAWSPDGTKIGFTSQRDGNFEIYVMDANGSNPINLTNHLSSDGDNGWSPDGMKIPFSSRRDGNDEIYVMDANGPNPIRLTNNSAFDLVPDWQRIAGFVTPTPAPTPTPSPTASPTPAADVSGSMTDSPDPVQVGQNLTYTILVSNGGPSGPAFVTVLDVVPANTTFVSVTPTQGSCTGTGFINCNLGAIAAFGSATVTLVVTPTQAGTVSNSAQVNSSTFFDPNTGNNFPSQSTTVLPAATPTPTPGVTATPTPTPTVCSWSAGPAFPIPVSSEAATSLGGHLYTFGGTTTGDVQLANAYKFDGAVWTPIAPLPEALSDASAVNDGTNIYVLGGSTTGGAVRNTIYRYNPSANTYTTLAPAATASWGHGAAYLGGKIYKFAGSASSGTTTALEIYDVTTNQWTAGAGYPQSVTSVHAFAHGTFIYGAGGTASFPLPIPTGATYRYDPGTNTWNDAAIADLPKPRVAAAGGSYNGGWVLAGGFLNGVVLDSVVFWDPPSNTWSHLPNMPAERSNMEGAALNGSFYVVGGGSSGTAFTNNNQKLTCSSGATPTPTPTPTSTPTPTPTVTPSPTPAAQAINLSTRMRVLTGDNVGIGGFIITGTAPKHVLIRAIGPSLTDFGVPDALPDPVLELHGPGSFATIINNNWRDDPVQEALIEATGIPPSNNLESAIDATLNPGAYTAVVRGNNNSTGVALIEVYDLSHAVPGKLANISTRAFVSTGNDIVIAGFILGNGSAQDRIVVRGLGPSLTDFGVPDVLANPTLELRDNNGTLLFGNNDWQDDPVQASEITAAGLALGNNLESGIAATLPPGAYTALLAGLNNGTGNGVVEVYDRGAP